jgi:uncharacterized lipoprotein YmbA
MHVLRKVLIPCLALLIVSGCVGRSPTVRYYELEPMLRSDNARADTPSIAVGPILLPRVLDRSQMVTRLSATELSIDEFHRWGSGLESEILSALGQNLGGLLGTYRVAIYPSAPFDTDYRVTADFRDFQANADNEVLLNVQWTVQEEERGETVIVRESVIRKPAEGSDPASRVSAHNEAIAELSREIAAAIQSLGASSM